MAAVSNFFWRSSTLQEATPSRALLAVYGHPDDESFGTGGTLALYARQGVRVALACATRGEAGEISDPALATPEHLGEARERELRCACAHLGVKDLYFLGYRDSGMAGTPDNEHPLAFARADLHDEAPSHLASRNGGCDGESGRDGASEATGKIVRLVRTLRPQVLITFDPQGGYGHPDHIKANRITVAAFAAAGDPAQYPELLAEGLSPFAPSKLYFMGLPRRFFRAIAAQAKAAGMDIARFGVRNLQDLENVGMPDELVTTEIDVACCWQAKYQAIQCHQTQLPSDSIFRLIPLERMERALSTEYFILAETRLPRPTGIETDLFAGLR